MIVPVFAALPPIETMIWIVLVVIGVVSSIVSNARKAVKTARGQVARTQAAPRPSTVVTQAMAPPPVLEAPRPVITRRPQPEPQPKPVPVPAHGTPAFRGMFERGNLIRAIVAAEVLGPPKALQEHSIWSPRHSEPSI